MGNYCTQPLNLKPTIIEARLINIEYNNWHSELTDIEVDSLVPDKIKKSRYTRESLTREFLKSYFIKTFGMQ